MFVEVQDEVVANDRIASSEERNQAADQMILGRRHALSEIVCVF